MFTLVEKFIVRIFSFSGAIWNVYFGRYYRRKIPIHIIDENPANHHLRAQAELSFFSTSFNSGEYEILDLFPHTRVSFNAIFKLKATIQKMLLKNSAVLSVWISWCKIQRLNLASWCYGMMAHSKCTLLHIFHNAYFHASLKLSILYDLM